MNAEQAAANKRLIRQKIIQLLAMREHSVLEIQQKCQKKFAPEQLQDLDLIIAAYLERGLISEQRFTEDYIRMRRRKGYGPTRLRQELQQRGINNQLIDQHLYAISNEAWQQQIDQILLKKFGSSEPDQNYKKQAKRAQFIQYRGFSVNYLCRFN